MHTPLRLSLLVQIPGPDGYGLMLEDLRSGRQQPFDSPEQLLDAVGQSVYSASSPGDGALESVPNSKPSPDKESA